MSGLSVSSQGVGRDKTIRQNMILEFNIAADAETLTIPVEDVGRVDAAIFWGDGEISHVTSFDDAALQHTYATAGVYKVEIQGKFPNIYFNNLGDKDKLLRVLQLGDTGLESLAAAFHGCGQLTSFNGLGANISNVTNLYALLNTCPLLEEVKVRDWDVRKVTDFKSCFRSLPLVPEIDVSQWETPSATRLSGMFYYLPLPTVLDVRKFDTSKVTDLSYMFRGSEACEEIMGVGAFDVSQVTDMTMVFGECHALKTLDLSRWNTVNVTTMYYMLWSMEAITLLNVAGLVQKSCVNIEQMFYGTPHSTDLAIHTWNVSGITSMDGFLFEHILPTERYDETLIAWSKQDVQSGQAPHFGSSLYTPGGNAEAARTSLINDHTWVFVDGGPVV